MFYRSYAAYKGWIFLVYANAVMFATKKIGFVKYHGFIPWAACVVWLVVEKLTKGG